MIYMNEIAKRLNRSETAVRSAIARDLRTHGRIVNLPPLIKVGGLWACDPAVLAKWMRGVK